jgi:hypothetical protein
MKLRTGSFFVITLLSFLLLLFFSTTIFSYKKTEQGSRAYENETIEVNQIETCITNYGEYGQNVAGTAGCWWPKGSGNAYIYGAGIWIAGVKSNGDSVVVNGYNTVGAGTECIPGPWEHNEDHLNNPQSHPEDRLYVNTVTEDFAVWPLVDSTGKKIIWGDQDTWCYFNSHEPSVQCYPDTITIPLTITRHTFAWTHPLLENMLFFEYIIQNTDTAGTDTIKNMYVGFGSDLDVGYADDDLVGIERIDGQWELCYTLSPTQEAGWDAIPPYYIGFVCLKGPVADDTVKVGQNPVNPDTIILPGERIPLTALKRFTRDIDPADDIERFLAMAGYDFYVNPPEYNPFGDSLDTDPNDKRMSMSSGPFVLAPGEADTVAYVMLFSNGNTGGLQFLKQEVDAARQFFNLK